MLFIDHSFNFFNQVIIYCITDMNPDIDIFIRVQIVNQFTLIIHAFLHQMDLLYLVFTRKFIKK